MVISMSISMMVVGMTVVSIRSSIFTEVMISVHIIVVVRSMIVSYCYACDGEQI